MFGSQILEVVIGMMLIYLLFSLLMTAVREAIEALLKTRAVDLEKAIAEMLHDRVGNGDRQALFGHPLIFGLFAGDYQATDFSGKSDATPAKPWQPVAKATPSYIPGAIFADAIIDLYQGNKLTTAAPALEALLRSAGNDPAIWRSKVIAWYDAGMDRATGWYRRRTQRLLFWAGLVLAIVMNINSTTLINHLATNDAVRQQLVAEAEAQVRSGKPVAPAACTAAAADGPQDEFKCIAARNAALQGLGLPIGWDAPGRAPWVAAIAAMQTAAGPGAANLLMLVLGFAATALAISLGAPFWFDMLAKVMNVRATMKPEATDAAPQPVAPAAGAVAPPMPPMREHDHADGKGPAAEPLVFG